MKTLLVLFLLLSGLAQAQQKEIRIYDGPAPGSEKWNWEEKKNNKNAIKLMTVFNVVNPTITVFSPDPSVANGTSVIVCPGGGFHFLSIDNEGNEVAKWLAKKGVTAFVLKYRTAHINTEDPFADMMAGMNGQRKAEWDAENKATIPLVVADGKAAIAYVRKHATEFKIAPDRIGIIGFSAGGTVTASSAFNYTAADRPDFVAPIYAYMPATLQSDVLPDAPPMFLTCASDDQLNLAPHTVELYSKWLSAKRPVEMIIYAIGGLFLGMIILNIRSVTCILRFGVWILQQGFLLANE